MMKLPFFFRNAVVFIKQATTYRDIPYDNICPTMTQISLHAYMQMLENLKTGVSKYVIIIEYINQTS